MERRAFVAVSGQPALLGLAAGIATLRGVPATPETAALPRRDQGLDETRRRERSRRAERQSLLSAERAPQGIRVFGLRPQAIPGDRQELLASKTHTRRLMTLAEMANVAGLHGFR